MKTQKKNEKLKKFITNFAIRNSVDDEDSEIGKMAAICGYGARLAYIDTNGDIRIKNMIPIMLFLLATIF